MNINAETFCPRSELPTTQGDCYVMILDSTSRQEIMVCRSCVRGRAIAASCPVKFSWTPDDQMKDINALRTALAYLAPKYKEALGVKFVATVARQHGMRGDVLDLAKFLGLPMRTVRGTTKILISRQLTNFIKGEAA